MERPHHECRLLVENIAGRRVDFAVGDHESPGLLGALPKELCQNSGLHASFLTDSGQSQRRHQVDRARVAVIVAHESLAASQDAFFWITKCRSDLSLQLEGELIRGASCLVVHLGAYAEEKVVGLLKQPALLVPENFLIDHLGRGGRSRMEGAGPEEILVVA